MDIKKQAVKEYLAVVGTLWQPTIRKAVCRYQTN